MKLLETLHQLGPRESASREFFTCAQLITIQKIHLNEQQPTSLCILWRARVKTGPFTVQLFRKLQSFIDRAALNRRRLIRHSAECSRRSTLSLLRCQRASGHLRSVLPSVRCDHTQVSSTAACWEHQNMASRGDCGNKKRLTLRPLCALPL